MLNISCRRDHLFYATDDKTTVDININWDSCHLSPNGVTALAYKEDGSLYEQSSPSSNANYISINLPEGVYDIVLFNNSVSEYKYISFVNLDSTSTASAVTAQSKASTTDSIIVYPPDTLATYVINGIEINKQMVDYYYNKPDLSDSVSVLTYTVTPQRRTKLININVHVIGLIYALEAPTATLNYVSDGCYLLQDTTLTTEVMQQFLLNTRTFDTGSTIDGTLSQSATSFGLSGGSSYILSIDFILLNSEHYPITIDVTDSVEYTYGYQPEININLEVELPETIGSSDGGGFNTNVTDWNDKNISLTM
ncbi:MAG: DUF5119 domain-containing protein [Rikenellaceae bacterium]